MDLEARALSDLRRIEAICCEHARGGTRKCLIDRIRQCQQRPVPAAAHSGFTVPRAQALCQHVPSTARHLAVTRLETLLLQQGHRREPHWGLRQRQLRPASKGIPGSRGYAHVVDKQHKSDNMRGLNLNIVKTAGLRQKEKLLALWELLKQVVKAHDSAYDLTSVQVNKNFSGHVHVDRNDTMYQYALSLGDFTRGGHLVMSTDDPYMYVKYDTRGRLTRCDGRHPHWVTQHQVATGIPSSSTISRANGRPGDPTSLTEACAAAAQATLDRTTTPRRKGG